jgi:crossover junction endodeoxyribonuclease RuvC
VSAEVVLGIDPGLGTTGFALVRAAGGQREVIGAGVVSTAPGTAGPLRLLDLHRQLTAMIAAAAPDVAAVEQLFFASNTTTAMQVAEARGVILLALAQAGLPVWEYTPMQVKVSLTGYGKATKPQVTKMVRAAVTMPQRLPDDAFDAAAVALCHLQSHRLAPGRRVS